MRFSTYDSRTACLPIEFYQMGILAVISGQDEDFAYLRTLLLW